MQTTIKQVNSCFKKQLPHSLALQSLSFFFLPNRFFTPLASPRLLCSLKNKSALPRLSVSPNGQDELEFVCGSLRVGKF